MRECRSDGPVSVHVTKLYHATDAQSFRAFGRVVSGTLKKGSQVKVLGEGYSPEDEEDMMRATVDDLWVSGSRLVQFQRFYAVLRPDRSPCLDILFPWKKHQRAILS